MKSVTEIDKYKEKYIGEDPSFGYANREGKIADIVDQDKLVKLKKDLKDKSKNEITILYNFVYFMIKETKGLSLEEIEEMWK